MKYLFLALIALCVACQSSSQSPRNLNAGPGPLDADCIQANAIAENVDISQLKRGMDAVVGSLTPDQREALRQVSIGSSRNSDIERRYLAAAVVLDQAMDVARRLGLIRSLGPADGDDATSAYALLKQDTGYTIGGSRLFYPAPPREKSVADVSTQEMFDGMAEFGWVIGRHSAEFAIEGEMGHKVNGVTYAVAVYYAEGKSNYEVDATAFNNDFRHPQFQAPIASEDCLSRSKLKTLAELP